jgi:hypothetical protein
MRVSPQQVFAAARMAGLVLLATVLLVAVIGSGLTVTLFTREQQLDRIAGDAARVMVSGPDMSDAAIAARYERLYGDRIGRQPEAADIKRYYTAQLDRSGLLVLDQTLTDYIRMRWDRVDAHTIPAGDYIGARAVGPDTLPLERFTALPAHYLAYGRHGYVLILPELSTGELPLEFSASLAEDFNSDAEHPKQLIIQPEPFDPEAYDFPSRGQSVHELFRLTADSAVIAATGPELRTLASALKDADAQYGLFRQNSNTALGCMLRASELHRAQFSKFREDPLFRMRLPGIGLGLWSDPSDHSVTQRCR